MAIELEKRKKYKEQWNIQLVENQRIFLGYSLVYFLSLLYNIFLHFCTLFISFLCFPDVYK